MGPYSDSKLIDGIIAKRRDVIHFMYKDYFPLILALIEKNSGTFQDAEDVFQDGLVALYLRCRSRDLILNCALRSYFYAVCRNIWLQRLERKHKLNMMPVLHVNDIEEKYLSRETIPSERILTQQRIFWYHFRALPMDCQEVLLMYFDRIPFKEVASRLGFTDENYAKVRKYLCKKLLRKRIMNDPEYTNCIKDE